MAAMNTNNTRVIAMPTVSKFILNLFACLTSLLALVLLALRALAI